MANAQIGNLAGFVDKRESVAAASRDAADSLASAQNYADRAAMESYLTANAPASYPAATLSKMTHNDLVYAVRTLADAASK